MTNDPVYHSNWIETDGLPIAVIDGGRGHPHAHHPLAGWRMKANIYLDGTVRPFSGEFGSRFFSMSPMDPAARRAQLELLDGTMVVLDLNILPEVERQLHCGRFIARVTLRRLPGTGSRPCGSGRPRVPLGLDLASATGGK